MTIDFDKLGGLVPAIIQDDATLKVLMLGFMNKEAYEKTVETGKVTFFSRTRNKLWTKQDALYSSSKRKQLYVHLNHIVRFARLCGEI